MRVQAGGSSVWMGVEAVAEDKAHRQPEFRGALAFEALLIFRLKRGTFHT